MKQTTATSLAFDIRWYRRQGYLVAGARTRLTWTFRGAQITAIDAETGKDLDCIQLRYRVCFEDGSGREVLQTVPLEWTACNYGGRRPWLLCPDCGGRVAILYACGERFACRSCCGLAYRTQQQSDFDRWTDIALKIRRQLGQAEGLGFVPLPGEATGHAPADVSPVVFSGDGCGDGKT